MKCSLGLLCEQLLPLGLMLGDWGDMHTDGCVLLCDLFLPSLVSGNRFLCFFFQFFAIIISSAFKILLAPLFV